MCKADYPNSAAPLALSDTLHCMYMPYRAPARYIAGPVVQYNTVHCMTSVGGGTRYSVAYLCDACGVRAGGVLGNLAESPPLQ